MSVEFNCTDRLHTDRGEICHKTWSVSSRFSSSLDGIQNTENNSARLTGWPRSQAIVGKAVRPIVL